MAGQHDQVPLNGKNSALRSRCPEPGPSVPSPQAGFSTSSSSASCLVSLPSLSPVVSFKKIFFSPGYSHREEKLHVVDITARYGGKLVKPLGGSLGWTTYYRHNLMLRIMDGSPPGSSVHRILCTRILEWVTIPFSRGSSLPRNRT